jgi:hypothetical protein
MTLIIQKPTGAKLVLRKELPADAEADAYIAAVEAADGQALESGVKFAIKNFVLCCKADGIWTAIKGSCILAGARTRLGALTPLVGAAPTSFNFVDGDYNRKTGLVGDGSTKYLDSNRANNADPQNSKHACIYASTISAGSVPAYFGGDGISGSTQLVDITSSTRLTYRVNSAIGINSGLAPVTGLIGVNRANSLDAQIRNNKTTVTTANASTSPTSETALLYRRTNTVGVVFVNARLAFYSIGESLDLALLDARVTDLINAFAAAIP